MSDDEIVKLKKKRTTLRASVTKCVNELQEQIPKTEESNVADLEETLEMLTHYYSSLSLVDAELEKLFTAAEFDAEFLKSEEYREKAVRGKFRATKKVNEVKQSISLSTTSISNQNSIANGSIARDTLNSSELKSSDTVKVKLPKLTIPKFYGDINHWLTFWNSYESAIHKNRSLDNVEKFHYLKAHLAGTALSTIEALAIGESTYNTAIDLLKERFAKEDLLIHTHMQNILNIKPLRNTSDVEAFRKFYDKLSIELRSLTSLGQSLTEISSVLCTTILKALPRELLILIDKNTNAQAYTDINKLLSFLADCLNSRERAEAIKMKFDTPPSASPRHSDAFKSKFRDGKWPNKKDKNTFSSCDLIATNVKQKVKCVFCNNDSHASHSCTVALGLNNEEKISLLRNKGVCFRCLMGNNNHISKNCKSKVICSKCGYRHVDIMCNKIKYSNDTKTSCEPEKESGKVLSNSNKSSKVLLQTLVVCVKGSNNKHYLRMLYDTGSQSSYISMYAVKMLNLEKIKSETIKHGLFGGLEISEKHNRYRINLSSLDGKYDCDIEVLDEKKICSSVPKFQNEKILERLRTKGIFINDISENEKSCLFEERPDEIHLLLGADCAAPLFTKRVEHFPDLGISAFQTKLGWTLMGKMKSKNENLDDSLATVSLSLHVSDLKLSELWRLEAIGISSNENTTKNALEEETRNHFLKTVKRDNTGRYEVALPWIMDKSILPTNKMIAEKSLIKTESKLKISNKRKEYQEIFDYWENTGIIEVVKNEKETGVHYLPHQPVIKESSETTKIRPVFNVSAHSKDLPSLNDCLAKGPNIIEVIPSILNRFRKYRIGISSDIEKAFCQIKITESDRDFLRFLWHDADNNLKIYHHNCVAFGLTSSSYLLAATLEHLLNEVPEHFLWTSQILRESFYIDNSLVSLNGFEETEKFINESKEILASAHFNLRCWQSNAPIPIIDQTENKSKIVPVLGLMWNLEKDILTFKHSEPLKIKESLTKREILSVTQKIFDPIGITAPITLIPKLILQQTWILKLKWDEKLPTPLNTQFLTWMNQLYILAEIEIPRWLNIDYENEDKITLHLFSDASRSAYATCAFLRAETKEGIKVQLVSARSRVAPIKPTSIPRLELLSCLISARLAKTILTDFKLKNYKVTYWTDSSAALGWIKGDQAWGTFVHNRVKEIRNSTEISDWKHIPGKLNPADLPSRGCNFDQLKRTRWWEGPSWLYLPQEEWPQSEVEPDEETLNKEKRKTVLGLLDRKEEAKWYYRYFSSYRKTVRMIAWIYRFFEKVKKTGKRYSADISVDEFIRAEKALFKMIQEESFRGIEDPSIRTLRPVVDADGILRAKTNIIQRKDVENFRYPVILPSNHPVVRNMIYEKHLEKQHAGVTLLMAHLRENVWILKSRKTIRNIIQKCIKCKRFNASRIDIEPGVPPEDRVREGAIFEVVGVDLAGPLHLSDDSKAWIVLFTCAIYRAIHLELVTSLSTESFIQALRRFIARRGRPYIVYSDNGTNFTGTNRALSKVDWNKVSTAASIQKIRWKFNPPTAAWWGGWWERLVRIVKGILRKVLGRASLNYEEMNTILCDCEEVINSRPITYVSEDNKDPSPLTPMMFLRELPTSGVPDIDSIESKELSKRAKYRQRIRSELRNRFRSEYLGQLRQQAITKNKFLELKVGDIVLIEDVNKRRVHWPLAKIIELLPGRDQVNRLARVKTANTILLRPITKLYPLELNPDNNVSFLSDKSFSDKNPCLASNPLLRPVFPVTSKNPNSNKDPNLAQRRKLTKIPPAVQSATETRPPLQTRAGRFVRPPQKLNLVAL